MATDTAGRSTSITCFVDDAARGAFPHVCARTGRPADGQLAVTTRVGARTPPWWTAALLLLGPIGWIVFLALHLSGGDGEPFTARLPWSTQAQTQIDGARRQRRARWTVFGAGVALVLAGLIVPLGAVMASRVILGTAVVAIVVALVGALAADRRLHALEVHVHLDASRRWVTLANVHPDFAQAATRGTVRDASR